MNIDEQNINWPRYHVYFLLMNQFHFLGLTNWNVSHPNQLGMQILFRIHHISSIEKTYLNWYRCYFRLMIRTKTCLVRIFELNFLNWKFSNFLSILQFKPNISLKSTLVSFRKCLICVTWSVSKLFFRIR